MVDDHVGIVRYFQKYNDVGLLKNSDKLFQDSVVDKKSHTWAYEPCVVNYIKDGDL